MRGAGFAIAEILLFLIGASVLGFLLGLLLRRPGATRALQADINRQAVHRIEELERLLSEAHMTLNDREIKIVKLKELEAIGGHKEQIEESSVEAVLPGRLQADLPTQHQTLNESDEQLPGAIETNDPFGTARKSEQPEDEPLTTQQVAGKRQDLAGHDVEYPHARQLDTGSGVMADLFDFEVGGAD